MAAFTDRRKQRNG